MPQYRNVSIGGKVIYLTRMVRIRRGALPGEFIEALACLIRRLATDEPPSECPAPMSAVCLKLLRPTAHGVWTTVSRP